MGVVKEVVQLEGGEPGVLLDGVLEGPPAATHVVVLCHGLHGTKDSRVPKGLSKGILAARPDLATYRFDFAGNGKSTGVFRFCGYEDQVRDVISVVKQLRARGLTVIAVCGHSFGGNDMVMYASGLVKPLSGDSGPVAPLVVNVSARFDMTRGGREKFTAEQLDTIFKEGVLEWSVKGCEKPFLVTKEDLLAREAIDMSRYAKALAAKKDVTLMTCHGEADDIIPVEDARTLHALLKDSHHILMTIPGADHSYKGSESMDALVKTVLWFISEERLDCKSSSAL